MNSTTRTQHHGCHDLPTTGSLAKVVFPWHFGSSLYSRYVVRTSAIFCFIAASTAALAGSVEISRSSYGSAATS